MTWDQVRSLHRKGFEIGAHTRTHVDLGSRRPSRGRRGDSRRAARAGAPAWTRRSTSFAYPYGRRANLTDAEPGAGQGRRDSAAAASCFGGINARGTDPFHLRRVPISGWYASPHQFGFEVAFGRTLRRGRSRPDTASVEAMCCATSEATGYHAGGIAGHLRPHAVRHPHAGPGGIRNLDADHLHDRIHQPAGAGRADGLRALPRPARRRTRHARR